jgi:hypothetical protein
MLALLFSRSSRLPEKNYVAWCFINIIVFVCSLVADDDAGESYLKEGD